MSDSINELKELKKAYAESENANIENHSTLMFFWTRGVTKNAKNQYVLPKDTQKNRWKEAQVLVINFLESSGYFITDIKIFDNCIGFQATNAGSGYAIYLYERTDNHYLINGKEGYRLLNYPMSENRTVLILAVTVEYCKSEKGEDVFELRNFHGSKEKITFFKAETINGKNILVNYISKEYDDILHRFMAFYNSRDIDIFNDIVTDTNPAIEVLDYTGKFYNDAVLYHFKSLQEKYDKMYLCYIRFNDSPYSLVTYIKDYGIFDITYNNFEKKIIDFCEHPLNMEAEEILFTDSFSDCTEFDIHRKIRSIKILPPETTQRFSVIVNFENNIKKKYVLPISDNAEVVKFKKHILTDKIFSKATLKNNKLSFACGLNISDIELFNGGADFNEQS